MGAGFRSDRALSDHDILHGISPCDGSAIPGHKGANDVP
jgi:hypothetical protein